MRLINIVKLLVIILFVMTLLVSVVGVGGYFYLNPKLPSIEGLSNVQLQVPLRIYSSDNALMGEFGEKRRTPKKLDEIPEQMRNAFLSAEDDRFFEHPGVDYQGIIRAVVNLILTGERGQGGSTITMQLARNFYLSSEKTYLRKLNEILLAFKIENELTKEEILELYLNKIYLGNRSYGVAAAAQIYYGKELEDLSLAQIAMIAGLPKAPSTYNPIINPDRAILRRNYVLARMFKLDYITSEQYEEMLNQPVTATRHHSALDLYAPYVTEMARAEIIKQFGDESYVRGLNVYTTVNKRLQQAADDSIWRGLVAYDQRHGYRGVIRNVDLNNYNQAILSRTESSSDEKEHSEEMKAEEMKADAKPSLLSVLDQDEDYGRFIPALIVSVDSAAMIKGVENSGTDAASKKENRSAIALLKDGKKVRIPWGGIEWARTYVNVNRIGKELTAVSDVLRVGDVIWLAEDEEHGWRLSQIPDVQGALVSVDPNSGAIQALTGGFNFERSKFNRVVQAKRQAGSSFKPIVYSAALEKKYTTASLINDAPVVFEDNVLESTWRPENFSGKFFGPTRLRMALYKSRNLVSVRLLRSIGINYVTKYAENFGLVADELPKDLSLALGSAEVSPLQLNRVFSVFANGGYLVEPYLIQRIEDADGTILFEAEPEVACVSCFLAEKQKLNKIGENESNEDQSLEKIPEQLSEQLSGPLPRQAKRTLEPRLAFQMNSILQDVVLLGTGRRALQLNRNDLAGKTGTTNDQHDAWFNGYNPDLVTTTWVGFDQHKPLGSRETAAQASLPIWIDFMKVALDGKPERQLPRPDGLVTMTIDSVTGKPTSRTDVETVFEIFREENAPVFDELLGDLPTSGGDATAIPEQLF